MSTIQQRRKVLAELIATKPKAELEGSGWQFCKALEQDIAWNQHNAGLTVHQGRITNSHAA